MEWKEWAAWEKVALLYVKYFGKCLFHLQDMLEAVMWGQVMEKSGAFIFIDA